MQDSPGSRLQSLTEGLPSGGNDRELQLREVSSTEQILSTPRGTDIRVYGESRLYRRLLRRKSIEVTGSRLISVDVRGLAVSETVVLCGPKKDRVSVFCSPGLATLGSSEKISLSDWERGCIEAAYPRSVTLTKTVQALKLKRKNRNTAMSSLPGDGWARSRRD